MASGPMATAVCRFANHYTSDCRRGRAGGAHPAALATATFVGAALYMLADKPGRGRNRPCCAVGMTPGTIARNRRGSRPRPSSWTGSPVFPGGHRRFRARRHPCQRAGRRDSRRRQRRSRPVLHRRALRHRAIRRASSLPAQSRGRVRRRRDLIALNFEFAWFFPLRRHPWSLYAGRRSALNIYNFDRDGSPGVDDNDTDVQPGLNFLFGIEHRRGFFTELKLGPIDSPEVKFAVGYTFK